MFRKLLIRRSSKSISDKLSGRPQGFHEVEFADDEGRAYAMVALRADQVMRLHYEPKGEAAGGILGGVNGMSVDGALSAK